MRQKPIPDVLMPFLDGKLLLIDKPMHWTSFDIVNKIRYLIKVKKVGHAGTLDPLATGLLIVCTGKFTKKINEYQGLSKEYTGSLILGATTASYDLETEPENFKSITHLTEDQIQQATTAFVGEILQMPPQHSAIKKEGMRLYESARKGIEVKVDPRSVHIMSFEITQISLPRIDFKVVCAAGTYIRSLVKDFGEALGVGAYMSELRRTKIGDFNIEEAIQWEDLKKEIDSLLASQLDMDNATNEP
jgi:tRNA pseudouridine55 synthase